VEAVVERKKERAWGGRIIWMKREGQMEGKKKR